MSVYINEITSYLPEGVITNAFIARLFPEWSEDKIYQKTGIRERRVAGEHEFASDLAYKAALALFQTGCCVPDEIDAIILCTQSPDYILPTTSCLLQYRLGIPIVYGSCKRH